MKANELKERLEVLEVMEAEFKKENKTGTVEPKRGASVEKIEASLERMEERIQKMEAEAKVRDNNKTVALGTSKIVSLRRRRRRHLGCNTDGA